MRKMLPNTEFFYFAFPEFSQEKKQTRKTPFLYSFHVMNMPIVGDDDDDDLFLWYG